VIPDAYVEPVLVPPSSAGRDSGWRLRRPKRTLTTRVLSLAGFAGLVWALVQSADITYRLLTDSFVAPLILSKDSDLAVQSKLSLGRLLAEKYAMQVRMGADEAAVAASEEAIARLEQVKATTATALEWSVAITQRQSDVGVRDQEALEAQERVIEQMISKQEALVAQLREHLAAGMIYKTDVGREEVALQQLQVAALANQRDRLASEMQREATALTQRSLARPRAKGIPATPEVIAHQDQLVKLDLELLKLRAEVGAKRLQREADLAQLQKLDELVADMKKRPIFRALEVSQNVAFVPYTQLEGVQPEASVLYCKWWGLFLCAPAGRVSEVVPGEVMAEDPWGKPMRGQYALLELSEPRAAQSQSLRVRPDEGTGRTFFGIAF